MKFSDFAVGLCFLAAPVAAWSHGDWPPKHGGVMNEGGETSFELVQRSDGIHVHVSDHGEAMETAGSTATLTVVNSEQVQTFKGSPRGKDMMFFPKASTKAGDKVTLRVQFGAGSIAVGRFLIPKRSRK